VPQTPADRLATVRRWARLLDTEYRIPGTNLRFGWDPILGLIPGIGDLVGPIFALVLLAHAWKLRVPKIVMARVAINGALDAIFGIIPLLGDTIDLFWKANLSSVALLERHHTLQAAGARRSDWLFVIGVVLVVLAAVVVPLAAVFWIIHRYL
jgi:hypothetical protein